MTRMLSDAFATRAARADLIDADVVLRAVLSSPSKPARARTMLLAGVSAAAVAGAALTVPALTDASHSARRSTTSPRAVSVAPGPGRSAAPATTAHLTARVFLHVEKGGGLVAYGPHGQLRPGDPGYIDAWMALRSGSQVSGDFPLRLQGHPARFEDQDGLVSFTVKIDNGRALWIVTTSRVSRQTFEQYVTTLDLSRVAGEL